MNGAPKEDISLIAALADNRVIGKDNRLLWRQKKDLQRFKRLTLEHWVVMGRKTFESIGCRPLPRRPHIIISRSRDFTDQEKGVYGVDSPEKALALWRRERAAGEDRPEIFLLGGGEIYREFLARATRMYLTWIHARPEGDAFFPPFEPENWQIVSTNSYPASGEDQFPFTFTDYQRK